MQPQPLPPGRGTKLYRYPPAQGQESLRLYVTPQDDAAWNEIRSIYVILDDLIAPLNHMAIRSAEGYMVMVPAGSTFMVINMSPAEFVVAAAVGWTLLPALYDPYLYEGGRPPQVSPEDVRQVFSLPGGHTDVLAKWYSIKFSYADYNIIFLRPGLGISLQTHQLREEHWEILAGTPIVVAGSHVHYECPPGSKYHIPLGDKHTIINPSDSQWVVLKETYTGTFDEEDIVRLFNPNHYQ